MIVATFPLRMVRACVKFPLSRITWRGNQYCTYSVIYGRLAPAFPLRATLHATKFRY
jgi:hypothetical protein